MLFTVIPAIEIYLLFSLGDVIGGLNTLLLVITTGVIGAALAKHQGLKIAYTISHQLESGELPTHQITHGLLVLAGGLLLLTPGILTDIFGLSLILPITRHLYAIFLQKIFKNGIANNKFQFKNYSSTSSRYGFKFSQQSSPFETSNDEQQGPRQVAPDTFETNFKEKK